jgi:hypothetical protein
MSMRAIDLTDPEWGVVKLAVTFPTEDRTWGDLTPLRGTSWERWITVVPAEAFSHAMHGWATPLMRVIGRTPVALARMVEAEARECRLKKDCVGWNPKNCVPRIDVPFCWEAPGNISPEAQVIVAEVVRAWGENRYVLVVLGKEFSLS